MNSVKSAVFPGILFGSLVVVWLGGLVADPQTVFASAALNDQGTAVAIQPDVFLGVAGDGEVIAEDEENGHEEIDQDQSDCSLGERFPDSVRRWCDLIERYAGEHGLDANLVAAVILQESNGNPQAYSKSGAVGLMQVMPRDGLAAEFMCKNGPCFANRPGMEELFDPEFNVEYGTRMLAGLINRYGSLRDALKAYGPKDVDYYYADIVLRIYERYR